MIISDDFDNTLNLSSTAVQTSQHNISSGAEQQVTPVVIQLCCVLDQQDFLPRDVVLPVRRVWLILTRSWVHQQSCTSGAGVLKQYKNHKVHHYNMGTTPQT